MADYLESVVSTKITPQSTPIPGENQVENSAGGYVYQIDCWQRLDRFLILGSEGGTYYVDQRELTVQNIQCVQDSLDTDAIRCIDQIVMISEAGRAPKNEPAILALALACGHKDAKSYAYTAVPRVCRIPTHLFHFVAYCQKLRGWGRGLRHAVARWYNDSPIDRLAYHVVKYQQRDGWSHKDVLRQAHVKPIDEEHRLLLGYCAGKVSPLQGGLPSILPIMRDTYLANRRDMEISAFITDYKLTHEMIPTQFKTSPEVWDALLPHMPMTAMVRNLGVMTKVGLLQRGSDSAAHVVRELQNEDRLKASRLHPLAILVALKIYAQGKGMRGSNTWDPVPSIIDALDEAFYLSFGNVEKTGKRLVIACDVSHSMGSLISGMPISSREAVAALAMLAVKVEGVDSSYVVAFDKTLSPLAISPKQRLDDVIRMMRIWDGSSTDCALPMIQAREAKLSADAFIVLTDNETWHGDIHPIQALRRYRETIGIKAKLAVVGMTATDFSIADPNDSGCLDVVGFDTATPTIVSNFITS